MVPRYQHDHINVDTGTGQAQWQGECTITPWHGHFRRTVDRIELFFDAQAAIRQGTPVPRSSNLFLPEGSFFGTDYGGRPIALVPKSVFSYEVHTGTWILTAEWSSAFNDWIALAAPPPPSPPRQAPLPGADPAPPVARHLA